MTTEQLREARIACGQLWDVIHHLDSEPPDAIYSSVDRIDKWLTSGRGTAEARKAFDDDAAERPKKGAK